METVEAVLDSHIRVNFADVGDELAEELLDEVDILNPDRLEAKEAGRHGWKNMPETFNLGDVVIDEPGQEDHFILPRGWGLQLKLALRDENMRVKWVDKRRYRKGAPIGKEEFSYRAHQPAAVKAIRKHQQGIYKAPTGSGKTVTVCGVIWELSPRRSLILVDRINLVDQWISRLSQHVGVPKESIGRIGDGDFREGERITVATIQTLYKKREMLEEEGFFEKYDLVCLDEMHHVTAETFRNIVSRFTARYRFGVSATPDKTGLFELALDVLGEVFYETTHEELRAMGLLVEPTVEVVPTEFKFTYWRDHKANKKGKCEIWGCPKEGEPYHRHKNNYHKLKSALVADEGRNELIVEKLIKHHKHVQLVITDQTSHIHQIEMELALCDSMVKEFPKVYILTGKQNGKKRAEIIAEIEELAEPCIILSTIAGEALDIPIIDVVHLIWPTSNPRKTEQNVGRGTRSAAGKNGALILDYVDELVGVLLKQFGLRRRGCYGPLGFEVKVPETFGAQRGGLGIVGSL